MWALVHVTSLLSPILSSPFCPWIPVYLMSRLKMGWCLGSFSLETKIMLGVLYYGMDGWMGEGVSPKKVFWKVGFPHF